MSREGGAMTLGREESDEEFLVDEYLCIGGCGRTTNGLFLTGTHGPGWYCGWCEAIPDA